MTAGQPASISIPFPDVENPLLRLTAAPARLTIAAGEAEPWVTGTYTDPGGETQHKISTGGSTTHLTHDRKLPSLRKGVPQFDLKLGTGKPFSLLIETGASDKTHCDLGGIPITELECRQGAGEFILDFSKPSPVEMTKLTVSAGAAALELRNLANSNAAEISVTGGVASFLVDFCGTLQRDVHASINTGIAELKITAPQELAIKMRSTSTLGAFNVGDGFMTKEGAYWTEAAIKGETPELRLEVVSALGVVKVRLM